MTSADGGYGPPPGDAQAAYELAPQTETKAVVALVLAIGSYLLLPVLGAIAALVLAGSARRDIDASGGRLTGRGLVTASRVLAWIHLALFVLAIIGVVVLVLLLNHNGAS